MNTLLSQEMQNTLAEAAAEAKRHSYSPYSHFKVGAAVLTEDGKIYTGTNIENASYGLTVCAERNAIFKAVGDGYRKLAALAVCTDPIPGDGLGTPCGACRQVMTEFMEQDAPLLVVSIKADGQLSIYAKQLKDFMPYPFNKL